MKLLLTLVPVLALATAAAACGGDGGRLTLEEYFERFAAIQERMEALVEEADTSQPAVTVTPATPGAATAEAASDQEQIDAQLEPLAASLPVLADFTEALVGIDPPAEVEDLHNEFVDMLREVTAINQDIVDQLEDAASSSDLEEVVESTRPQFIRVLERGARVCSELQEVADANGIDVDLGCEVE